MSKDRNIPWGEQLLRALDVVLIDINFPVVMAIDILAWINFKPIMDK